jgi:hypothetical protein
MDAAMQFVQVDDAGRPESIEGAPTNPLVAMAGPWSDLRERALKLLAVRS